MTNSEREARYHHGVRAWRVPLLRGQLPHVVVVGLVVVSVFVVVRGGSGLLADRRSIRPAAAAAAASLPGQPAPAVVALAAVL